MKGYTEGYLHGDLVFLLRSAICSVPRTFRVVECSPMQGEIQSKLFVICELTL